MAFTPSVSSSVRTRCPLRCHGHSGDAGILGATFVPCQAWTTAFFDKKVVGTANALVGGWGNSGGESPLHEPAGADFHSAGGFTFIIMVALYERLVRDGLTGHSAWRAAFAIVPVPILLATSVLVMVFGTDHPAGRWSERHNIPAAHLAVSDEDVPDRATESSEKKDERAVEVTVSAATTSERRTHLSAVDTAVNQPLTARGAAQILASPLTWLPAAAYATTFGFELAIDAYLSNILFGLYKSPSFGQTKAGYVRTAQAALHCAYSWKHRRWLPSSVC